jgi:hypothetical protein
MPNIDTKGLKVAELTDQQFAQLRDIEQKMNDSGGNQEELYLLAVTRH